MWAAFTQWNYMVHMKAARAVASTPMTNLTGPIQPSLDFRARNPSRNLRAPPAIIGFDYCRPAIFIFRIPRSGPSRYLLGNIFVPNPVVLALPVFVCSDIGGLPVLKCGIVFYRMICCTFFSLTFFVVPYHRLSIDLRSACLTGRPKAVLRANISMKFKN